MPLSLAIMVGAWVASVETRINVNAAAIKVGEKTVDRIEELFDNINQRLATIEGEMKRLTNGK